LLLGTNLTTHFMHPTLSTVMALAHIRTLTFQSWFLYDAYLPSVGEIVNSRSEILGRK